VPFCSKNNALKISNSTFVSLGQKYNFKDFCDRNYQTDKVLDPDRGNKAWQNVQFAERKQVLCSG